MYKDIVVATGSQSTIPLLKNLLDQKILRKVIVPNSYAALLPLLAGIIPNELIEVTQEPKNLNPKGPCDLIIIAGYPDKVELVPNIKMINVHFGKLPENKGNDPIFQDLKNGRKMAYVSIHEVSEELDGGDILAEKGFDIFPGENSGMLHARLGSLSLPIVNDVIRGRDDEIKQNQSKSAYFGKPSQEDLQIKWHSMTAKEIENLVNACNPKHSGAITFIQGSQLNIWEVSLADVPLPKDQTPPPPGTVVHANPDDGIFVICKNQTFVRLNIISTIDGLFSGQKLASLGTSPGILLG